MTISTYSRFARVFLLAALVCLSGCSPGDETVEAEIASAEDTEMTADLGTLEAPNEQVTGEELFVVCTFCHGTQGQGNLRRDGPALAGLDRWYLELQMHNFKNGLRGNLAEDVPGQVMHYASGMLRNDFTISSLAEYISTLEPGQPLAANAVGERSFLWESPYAALAPTITPNAEAGAQTYQSVCVACHGADGNGLEALGAANLNYLHEPYIIRQLKYFRDGIRGAHPGDIRGQQMAAIAQMLPDEQAIADVAVYIAGLNEEPQQ
jgi:cytochrome c oxidase subunit 2